MSYQLSTYGLRFPRSRPLKQTITDSWKRGFDGIFGFSQGAIVAAVLCARRPSYFRVALLVSGGIPAEPSLASLFREREAVCTAQRLPRAMHVYGKDDKIMPPQRTLDISDCWDQGGMSSVFCHEGGHMIPASKEFRDAVRAFVGDALACSDQAPPHCIPKASERIDLPGTEELRAAVCAYVNKKKCHNTTDFWIRNT